MPIPYAFTSSVDDAIFRVASALEVPVLVLALVALALVVYELGAFLVELHERRGRRFTGLLRDADRAREALNEDKATDALAAVAGLARSGPMRETLTFIVEHARSVRAEPELNKALADFDLDSQRRLGRTRMLVRFGPALGLMGTLIPLSPALTGLAHGDTDQLSHDLRVAFSVTVLGLLIGAVAYALSLARDRMYSQDLSDLQYLAAVVSDARPTVANAPAQPGPT